MPPLNLNLLRSLDVLLDARNLTVAARELGITQSALSRQLAQLRTQLADPLLIRDGQRYLLTARAEALREPLKARLQDLAVLLHAPDFDPATCTRQFSLAGSDYIADHMLPALAARMAVEAPLATLSFHAWAPDHYRLLSDEGLDLVPVIADAPPDNLHGRAMGEDKPVCVMRSAHPLATTPWQLADYLAGSHLRIGGGGDKDHGVDTYLARLGMQRKLSLAVPFYSAALRVLCQGDFLLTLPEHIATIWAGQFPIVWRPLPFDAPTYRYWLLWHARSHHDAAHQWFRGRVFDLLQRSLFGVTQFNLIFADPVEPA